MEHSGPSRTAWSAACHRAAHQVLEDGHIFRDPLALTILGAGAEPAVQDARRSPHRKPMRVFIAARHRVAEDAIGRAVTNGTRQVVVLGAGLDTFAYRNPFANKGVRVVEVDHPATQAWKREQLASTRIPLGDTTGYASVDFETDDLAEQLPEEFREAHRRRARSVSSLGEPWQTYFDSSELADELGRLGLRVTQDVGPTDIAVRWFGAPAGTAPRPGGHVVVADRD